MKTNNCIYCSNVIKGQRNHFCSSVCNDKYWRGVYSKKWKKGALLNEDKPTEEELKLSELKYIARQFSYKKYKIGEIIKCDICKVKTKHIHRHHEDYNMPDVCMLLCPKCHGFIKRYNSLKKMFYTIEKEDKI